MKIQERHFDLINTHFVVPTGPLGAYLSGISKIPNVLTVHGGDLYDPSKFSSPHRHLLLRVLIRRLLRGANVVVGQSRNTIKNVHDIYLPDLNCELIPLGIKRPIAPSVDRAALGFSQDELLLITVGRLLARKAVNQLIDMMSGCKDKKVRLIVVGDGPLRGDLQQQAQEVGAADRVVFTGFLNDENKRNL